MEGTAQNSGNASFRHLVWSRVCHSRTWTWTAWVEAILINIINLAEVQFQDHVESTAPASPKPRAAVLQQSHANPQTQFQLQARSAEKPLSK